jgi:PIN domain nuclease of toxin-antitoxin system
MTPNAFLLDMHTFLWWNADDPRLSQTCRDLLENPAHRIYLSVASGWEIAIKHQIGKLDLPEPPETYVRSRVIQNNFEILPITLDHALLTNTLPLHHKDPFDRILIAQSIIEGLPLLSADTVFAEYAVVNSPSPTQAWERGQKTGAGFKPLSTFPIQDWSSRHTRLPHCCSRSSVWCGWHKRDIQPAFPVSVP